MVIDVGIIGAGSIGTKIASVLECDLEADGLRLVAVCDLDASKAKALADSYYGEVEVANLERLTELSDVVIECAGAGVVLPTIRQSRKNHAENNKPNDILVMSVGGILGLDMRNSGPSIHIPSGAIGGLDAIKAMREGGLDEVMLITRKPPISLGIETDVEKVLFDGSAEDVVELYPKNVNVAMALSLAGIGPGKTRVRLIADPGVSRNTHHIVAKGKAGEVEFTSRNLPFPENPRTSYLAALSAIAVLRTIVSTLKVG